MDFLECIQNRRSIRKFSNKELERERLKHLIKIASFSPSWKNTQIVKYFILDDVEKKNYIAENCTMNFKFNTSTIKNAPVLILVAFEKGVCGFEKDGSYSTSKGDSWQMFDAGIATQTLSLAAHNEGLGSVILGIFDEDKIKGYLDIDEKLEIAALVAIGYPNQEPNIPKRKDIEELVQFI